jgi:hypothetical protein
MKINELQKRAKKIRTSKSVKVNVVKFDSPVRINRMFVLK